MSTEKQKSLTAAVSQIERQFGKGSIMKFDENYVRSVPVISTGDVGLDTTLGIGGLPCGRIVEIYGPESSGKTTLALHVIAECQKAGGTAVFVDAEHALDVGYARRLGVKVNEMLISQPDFGEQALEVVDILVRSGGVDIVIVDSVAALTPKNEVSGEMGDTHVGLQARLMSQALRKLTSSVSRTNCLVVFINQLRQKIGVMFGNPEVTTGGVALKFYSSVRLDIRRIGPPIKNGDEVVGNRVKVKVVKNKMAPPFGEIEFDVMFGQGISKSGSLLDLAASKGIVVKSGAWYSYENARIGQGRENAKQFLQDNPKAFEEISDKLREMIRPKEKPAERENEEVMSDEAADKD